jgi:hypothetical protein
MGGAWQREIFGWIILIVCVVFFVFLRRKNKAANAAALSKAISDAVAVGFSQAVAASEAAAISAAKAQIQFAIHNENGGMAREIATPEQRALLDEGRVYAEIIAPRVAISDNGSRIVDKRASR